MRRLLSLCLVALLLAGCSAKVSDTHTVTFYYPKKDYISAGLTEGVMGSEERDAADEELEYLLRLYLLGPLEEHLQSLYPKGTELTGLTESGGTLTVSLSGTVNRMNDAAFTLAGACLASTCFPLKDYSAITVRSGDREITFQRDSLIFQDDTATLDNNTIKKEDTP